MICFAQIMRQPPPAHHVRNTRQIYWGITMTVCGIWTLTLAETCRMLGNISRTRNSNAVQRPFASRYSPLADKNALSAVRPPYFFLLKTWNEALCPLKNYFSGDTNGTEVDESSYEFGRPRFGPGLLALLLRPSSAVPLFVPRTEGVEDPAGVLARLRGAGVVFGTEGLGPVLGAHIAR